MHKAIEIGPFIAIIDVGHGPLTHRSPDLPNNGFETQAMFIKRPTLHNGPWILTR